MATTVEKFLSKCEEVVKAKPAYKLGASSLTECDCIGMDKYAFRENGVSLQTSGTNYSVRYQVDNLRIITGADDLRVGDAVFKANLPDSTAYSLPARYKPGGNDYTGDLNDYYHIGTVASVSPLRIIHMTSPTSKVDSKIGNWGFAAEWKEKYLKRDDPEPEPEPEPEPQTAVVYAPTGSTVNLRKSPKITAPLVERVPIGSTVKVSDYGDDWCGVVYKWYSGFMQTRFLRFEDDSEPCYTVTISGLTKEEAEALCNEFPGAEVTAG